MLSGSLCCVFHMRASHFPYALFKGSTLSLDFVAGRLGGCENIFIGA